MTVSGALLSMVVMGVLLVGASVAVSRRWHHAVYTPTFRPRGDAASPVPGGGVSSETVAFAATAVLLLVAALAVFLDAASLLLVAIAPTLLAAFFAWGTYHIGRAHGLPQAHSVGLSAWLFAVVLVGVIAAKLLFG